MSAETRKETHAFQAEVTQLLHLMIHSLYSNREIFLRELISNASDANDRLRFAALSEPSLTDGDSDLAIEIDYDREAGTVTVRDNGIGMTRDEVVEHLGTIARSGTARFLGSLTGDQKKDSQLIGQFGVGFYASFIVAERVEVFSRRAGHPAAEGVHWVSTGEGEFTVADVEQDARGTTVVLHLREDAQEFADGMRLRHLVTRYSDHIGFPVRMRAEIPAAGTEDGEQDDEESTLETVNAATALWTRPRQEVTDDEYKAFYKHVAHDFEDPLAWSHHRVEGKREYTSLLYVPARAPFDLWNRESPRGLKLYVQRVFIMDEAEQFLPLYLRFVRGVIDSADLPLNVSRELLQRDAGVDALKSALTRRALDTLAKLAKDRPEDYARFWGEFGQVLKEGPAEDPAHQEQVAGLLRFASTATEGDAQTRSLADYVAAMKEGQKAIYYLLGENATAVAGSPHLEVMREKGLEVLLLSDRIDEWLVTHLREFDGHPLADVSRGDLDLGDLESDSDRDRRTAASESAKDLIERLKTLYGDQVTDVRVSTRLVSSPACIVRSEDEPGAQMRQILAAAGQALPLGPPVLEINPEHALLSRLDDESDDARFEDLAWVILDQARLSEGGELPEPAGFVERINRLLTGSGEAV
jgi:molecular chaperone HtpG